MHMVKYSCRLKQLTEQAIRLMHSYEWIKWRCKGYKPLLKSGKATGEYQEC